MHTQAKSCKLMFTSNIRTGGKCKLNDSECDVVVGSRRAGLQISGIFTQNSVKIVQNKNTTNVQWVVVLQTETTCWWKSSEENGWTGSSSQEAFSKSNNHSLQPWCVLKRICTTSWILRRPWDHIRFHSCEQKTGFYTEHSFTKPGQKKHHLILLENTQNEIWQNWVDLNKSGKGLNITKFLNTFFCTYTI